MKILSFTKQPNTFYLRLADGSEQEVGATPEEVVQWAKEQTPDSKFFSAAQAILDLAKTDPTLSAPGSLTNVDAKVTLSLSKSVQLGS